jgi:death on curing protein
VTAPAEPLVSIAELMFIHTVIIDRYGGHIGVRDNSLIESALVRPLASFEGRDLYPGPFLRAAVLWHGLIKNHGFVDANKRTSTMAMQRWLYREGFDLFVEYADLVELAVRIANSGIGIEEIATWLEDHAQPVGG